MSLHVHHLTGCAPEPLAGYLKGLGILRVVSEQKDQSARGWWRDEHFCLMTTLNPADLKAFFLEEYAPTPVFNPWGARSGYYPDSSEKSTRANLLRVENSLSPRLASFRSVIADVRRSVEAVGGIKPELDEAHAELIVSLQNQIRGAGRAWLSTVTSSVGETVRTPPIFGTGGNEGSGSYTAAFLGAVVSCVIDRAEDESLILGSATSNTERSAVPAFEWAGNFGQFVPDGRGSAWDLLLAFEGATLFASSVVSRSGAGDSGASRFMSSPFYFATQAAGSGSMAEVDEFSLNKGRRNPGRGEQWFPLWSRPATLDEIRAITSEGRCVLKGRQARGALDAAMAISRLGSARGIDTFLRYGYLQRNNQATHFAVPIGRVDVRERSTSRLLDDLAGWSARIRRQARDGSVPARLRHVERRLADAMFAVLVHDESPDRWQAVLLAAADVEANQVGGSAIDAGPTPFLSLGWLEAADDGTQEWRLACALGSAAAEYRQGRARDGVRRHWLPLDRLGRRYEVKDKRLAKDPRVVATGRDPVNDLTAVVLRRLLEATRGGERRLPLISAAGYEAAPSDLAQLIAGHVDLDRVVTLARSLMAVRWEHAPDRRTVSSDHWPDESWMAIRVASLPWPLDSGRDIPVDDAMISRLVAGDGPAAVSAALRRLRASGLRPNLHGACVDPDSARLWAAALAFPISRSVARSMARRLDASIQKEFR